MSYFSIYSSSAGSGKTYTLAKEYLKLALMDDPLGGGFRPGYFRHILAVTFTNDAAHEMKQRILSYLRGFAFFEELSENEQKKLAFLRETVRDELNANRPEALDYAELTRRAGLVFNRMLHHYADVGVGTIDSFVQRVASVFAEELDLPANFEVSLDQQTLLEAAVQNLLAKAGHEEQAELTAALHDFAEEKSSDGANFNKLAEDLTTFAAVLLQEHRHDTLERLRELSPADFGEIRRRITRHNADLDAEMQATARQAVDLFDQHGLEASDFFQTSRGIFSFFTKWAVESDWAKDLSAFVRQTLDDDKWAGAKTPKPTVATIESIKPQLRGYAERLVNTFENQRGKYLLFARLNEFLMQLTLLSYLRHELADVQRDSGQVHLSNFGKAIIAVVLNEPMPFVYERLGERYRHILIDEFQDTSTTQWTNFLPLVSNSVASQQFSLAVGDGKQAIYGWRGGEMQQIVHLHTRNVAALLPPETDARFEILLEHYQPLHRSIQPKVLNTNYRSCREIIGFNNDFFEYLLASQGPTYSLLELVYQTYRQETPDSARSGGHVQIEFLPTATDDDETPALGRVLAIIEEAKAAGYGLRDVAILCRTNRQSKEIAGFLKERDFAILSADSLLLRFSEPVNFVIALLRVLYAPEQTLPRYEALHLFHRFVLRQEPDQETATAIQSLMSERHATGFYQHLSRYGYFLDPFRLQQAGLYELVEKLIGAFHLFERCADVAYLFRLLDVVLDFSVRHGAHLADFLRFWDERKDKLAIQTPAGAEAVTVTSVHKSKGLEYPVVILPYADWRTVPMPNDVLWANLADVELDELSFAAEGETPPRRLLTAQVKRVKDLGHTPLGEQYQREQEKTFIENVNMLYVALTRPTDRLYLLAGLDKKGQPRKETIGLLLKEFLVEAKLWQEGRLDYCLTGGQPKPPSAIVPPKSEILTIGSVISQDPSGRVRLRRLAERLFDFDTFEKNRERSNKLKAALEKIKIRADAPRALDALVREGWATPDEAADLRPTLDALLAQPLLAPLFAPGLRVELEKEILIPDGNPLRPDRTTWLPDGRVVVLDFRTGPARDTHPTTVRRYLKQYREMGFDRVEGLLVYLEAGEVLAVEEGEKIGSVV